MRNLPLLVLLAMLLSAAPAHADPLISADPLIAPDQFGMVVRDPNYEPSLPAQHRMGELLGGMGVRWVRLEFHIPLAANATDAAVDAELAKYDYFLNTVAPQYNLKVLAVLGFGLFQGNPCALNAAGSVSPRFGGGVNPAIETFLSRALRIADRFGTTISAYEVLNEMNRLPVDCDKKESGATIDGKSYLVAIDPKVVGRMITKFYRFCQGISLPNGETAHCPAAQIIVGGLHPKGSPDYRKDNTAITDARYLELIYSDASSVKAFRDDPANAGRNPFDGVAYHPYPREIELSPNLANDFVDRGIARIRAVMAKDGFGDACRPLWVTEVGYNVDQLVGKVKQTEAGQANFLRDVFSTLGTRRLSAACDGAREIAAIFWFKYEDFPPAADVKDRFGNVLVPAQKWGVVRINFDASGIYDPSGEPLRYRPSYWAYMDLTGKLLRVYAPTVRR